MCGFRRPVARRTSRLDLDKWPIQSGSATVRHGATCQRTMGPTRLATIASCAGDGAGIWDQIMEALAAGHDAAVQLIDTSVVRVHQHSRRLTSAERFRK